MNYQHLGAQASVAMHQDLFSLAVISKLYDRYLPWSAASLRPSAIRILVNDILLNRRVRVAEFGSGISTVYLAAAVAQTGGRLVSLDHDAEWQASVRAWLPESARPRVELIHAPLVTPPEEKRSEWYDGKVVREALQALGGVDLVLFDGPPAYDDRRCFARRPGLAAIQPFLAPSATVVLDDINRGGEQLIAQEWSAALHQPHVDLTVAAGVAMWTLNPLFNTV